MSKHKQKYATWLQFSTTYIRSVKYVARGPNAAHKRPRVVLWGHPGYGKGLARASLAHPDHAHPVGHNNQAIPIPAPPRAKKI